MHVISASMSNPRHQQAIIRLLDMYSQDQFGASQPLATEVAARLIGGLLEARAICFLAEDDQLDYIGLAICIPSFSSFKAKPVLNIHDIAVSPQHRGNGIGWLLLAAVEEEARRRGCCKVTLEVRSDNEVAMAAYRRFGFAGTTPETLFWEKHLESPLS